MKKYLLLIIIAVLCITNLPAQDNYKEISLPELMQQYRQHKDRMVIVDVRTGGEYHDTLSRFIHSDIGRIKGAIHMELRRLQVQQPESIAALEKYKDKDIYLICSHSYRSRSASNILSKNGFTNVTNVQGGMTEWFRRSEEMMPYRDMYETSISYTNIGPAQLYKQLQSKANLLLIGINIPPQRPYDSAMQGYLQLAPSFKQAHYYMESDSMKIWELVQKEKGKPVVLFNNYSDGAAQIAAWLAGKGVKQVSYLVGGVNYFHEYLADNNLAEKFSGHMAPNSTIRFISPGFYCREVANHKEYTVVDLRHDTLFNKPNSGMKKDFIHLKDSENFDAGRGAEAFLKTYPDKKGNYVLISRYGLDGIDLAGELAKKGYRIYWLISGIQRFDWYSTNVNTFTCGDELLR